MNQNNYQLTSQTMRKFLLLISAMLVTTCIFAQDVYSSGYYTNSDGQKIAAVYKNGDLLYESSLGSEDNTSDAIIVDPYIHNVFWVRNSDNYGDVFQNGDYLLNNDSGTHVNDLFGSTGLMFATGYKYYDGVKTAVLWRNSDTTPLHTYGDGVYDSEATCGMIVDGTCYVGGWQETASSYHGMIWYSDGAYIELEDGTKIFDIALFNGNFYSVGTFMDGSTTQLVVWENNNLIYNLVNSNASNRAKIFNDGDDIYVVSYGGSNPDVMWKNGEEYYTTPGYFMGLTVNSDGVYVVGQESSEGKVWKDGEVIYAPSGCSRLLDVSVTLECENYSARTLPYYENFNMGETEWQCWTTTDEGDNGLYSSYWLRSNDIYHSSDVQAKYTYNASFEQEGWLISPQISLLDVSSANLGFNTREGFPTWYEYEGVWISTSGISTSNFTEVWTQTNPEDEWHWIDIDLTPYVGNVIYVAFKYTGLNAHNWYVDDIEITGVLGVDDITTEKFSVYPNPANENIRINGIDKETEVSIYNVMGVLVKTVVTNGNDDINVSELPSGLYMARFGENTLRFTKE